MKKILSLLFVGMFVCAVSFAQTAFHQTVSNPSGTVTNTGIDTMTYALSASYSIVSIQPLLAKTSGTIAGTSILQVSVNGTNYINTDTLTNTNIASSTTVWTKQTAARYFRVIVTGSGTMVGVASAKISAK